MEPVVTISLKDYEALLAYEKFMKNPESGLKIIAEYSNSYDNKSIYTYIYSHGGLLEETVERVNKLKEELTKKDSKIVELIEEKLKRSTRKEKRKFFSSWSS